jgi:type I restriction enzyme, S subunit
MTNTAHDTSNGELPDRWEVSPLGQLPSLDLFVDGDWVESKDQDPDGCVRLTQLADVGEGRFRDRSDRWLRPDQAERLGVTYLKEGDLLVARMPDPLGRCCRVPQLSSDAVTVVDVAILRVGGSSVDPSFLMWLLNSPEVRSRMLQLASGTTRKRISRKNLATIDLPLPPLAEQERIVEILEANLSRLDAALQHIQTLRDKAAQFRRSLLHAAFTGALTGHDPSTGELPDGWRSTPLADLLLVSIGGVWGSGEGESEVDVDVIRVTELKPHGVIDPSSAARRSITRKQLASRRLSAGDLLLEKSGGGPKTPVGRVGMVPSLDVDSVCANFMLLMRVDPELANTRLLHLFLNFFHSDGRTVEFQTSTTNIRNIKTPDYLQVPIPVPPLPEQERIVEILEAHLSRLDAALAVADVVEERAGALRRSLLHAAFTGKLTEKWREQAHV